MAVSVSAVSAVVRAVILKLQDISTKEIKLLWGVKEQVHNLVGDLEAMHAALIDANDRCYHHASSRAQKGFHVWVNHVREVTYETEDAVEEFMVHFSSPVNCCSHLKHLKARHNLAYKIKKIRSTVKLICQRRNAFVLVIPGLCSRCLVGGIDGNDPRSASLWIDEADIVGIDTTKEHMVNMILGEDPRLAAAFVTGMGGLGKTTLLKKVFDSSLQTGNFKHHAWVTVSKSFDEKELLRSTLKVFKEAANEPVDYSNLQQMSNVQLVGALRNHLVDVKFILALDDMWTADAWEVIKHALPDSNCCSRILITTRNDGIVSHFDTLTCFVHKLQPLQEKEAWTLFCRKAFRGNDKGICPKDLEAISLGILNKCDGLPLAIVAIGGVLSKKNKIMSEWKHVFDSLFAELSSDGNLEGLWKILLLSYCSYDELSYYLKTCYLYIGVFPEDFLIKRSQIVRLWVAERLVEEKVGLTLEDVAEGYLNEFVNRNMIQVVEKDDLFNRVKTFRVHDIMREIILSKSKEDALVEVLDDKNVTDKIKARRVSIHHSCERLLKSNKGELWSLLLNTSLCADSLLDKKFFKGFIRLKVVDLQNAGLFEFPDPLVELIHLRYLSLRGNGINTLPESIGKLKNLEILDLNFTAITSLPNGILKLKQLLYLRNYHFRFGMRLRPRWCGMEVPAGIGILTNLHKLGNIQALGEVGRATINEIGKLEKLRKLGLTGLSVNSGSDVCASLATLSHLRSLFISSAVPSAALDLSSLSSTPQFLQDVLLRCGLDSLPKWISSLNYLSKLVLQYSNLEQDPLTALQDLPSLVVLELEEAYNGKELCCGGTGYLKLKHLRLHNLRNLERVKLLNGAMPVLRQMVITDCDKLKMMPEGIDNLKELEYVKTCNLPLEFCKMLQFTGGLKVAVGPHDDRCPVERAYGSSSCAN